MKKISINVDILSQLLPYASTFPFLPRKKKKALKKKMAADLLRLAEEYLITQVNE
jgi:hypothetical protein